MKQLQEDRYVNASELAQILNVSRATVYQMSRKGFLPKGKKIGSLRRWSLNEIQEFMKGEI